MDKYGQIGPEKTEFSSYQDDVATVALELGRGRAVTFALTHRMTRQQVTVALKDQCAIIGRMHGGGPPGTNEGRWLHLAVDEKGAYWVSADKPTDSSYLANKLGLNPVDAETLAEFLTMLGKAMGHTMGPVHSHVEVIR